MMDLSARGRALMGGTLAMRQAGETFLPKFDKESVANYKARLNASWLFNGYRKTVYDMTGRVFDKPVTLADGAPAQFVEWSENIDMMGNDLSTFSRQVFQDALSGPGISYILVDAPQREGDVTQDQAQAQNLRPFMTHIKAEHLLGVKAETINNAMTLTQARIYEVVWETSEEDEFDEVEIEQIRVLDRREGFVSVRLYRKDADRQWVQFGDEYATGLQEITLVPVYVNRVGFFQGAPLLDDLADVNIAHWQSQSDQRNILHYARVPILFGSGRSDDEAIVISSAVAVTSIDPAADLKWVEHSGAAMGAGRQDLKDLEFQMEAYGLQLLVARAQSATGEALDAKKETSILAMTADQLKDALDMALFYMGEYAGIPAPECEVNKEFGVSMMTAQEAQMLLSAVNTGQLTRRTFLAEMVRRGMLSESLDVDLEDEQASDGVDDLDGVE